MVHFHETFKAIRPKQKQKQKGKNLSKSLEKKTFLDFLQFQVVEIYKFPNLTSVN